MSLAGRIIDFGSDASFCFIPLEAQPSEACWYTLFWDGKPSIFLQLESFPFLSYCGVDLDTRDIELLPPELNSALIDCVFSTVFSTLPKEFSSRLRLGGRIEDTERFDQVESVDLQWFSCELNVRGIAPIFLTVAATRALICSEITSQLLLPQIGHPDLTNLIRVPIERLLGTAVILVSELWRLARGDCILVDTAARDDERAVLVDGRLYLFVAHEAGWITSGIQSSAQLVENSHLDVKQEPEIPSKLCVESVGANFGELGDIPVRVTLSFHLGSTETPIGAIQTWQTGAIVCLPEEVTSSRLPVSIRANGLRIAEGDLVHIDDRVAVRLSRIFFKTSPHTG